MIMSDKHLKPGQPTNDIAHDVTNDVDLWLNPPRATELAPGVTLFTRDSSATGNAIVVKQAELSKLARIGGLGDYLARTNQKLWLVETDFGNQMILTDSEIYEMFTLGYQQDYNSWWDQRMAVIQKGVRS
jgi:hypothetical protein